MTNTQTRRQFSAWFYIRAMRTFHSQTQIILPNLSRIYRVSPKHSEATVVVFPNILAAIPTSISKFGSNSASYSNGNQTFILGESTKLELQLMTCKQRWRLSVLRRFSSDKPRKKFLITIKCLSFKFFENSVLIIFKNLVQSNCCPNSLLWYGIWPSKSEWITRVAVELNLFSVNWMKFHCLNAQITLQM